MDDVIKKLKENKDKAALEIEKSKAKKVGKAQLIGSKIAWIGGAIVFDAVTSYLIYLITAFVPYGLMWLIGGGGGLAFAEWLWERVGNNHEQRQLAELSKIVSAIAIAVMALIVGVSYALRNSSKFIEIAVIVSTLCLFLFHIFQAYKYHSIDDDYIEATAEARAEEAHQRELKNISRAAREVAKAKEQTDLIGAKRTEHGAAFDVAYGTDVKAAELQEARPTQAPPKQ